MQSQNDECQRSGVAFVPTNAPLEVFLVRDYQYVMRVLIFGLDLLRVLVSFVVNILLCFASSVCAVQRAQRNPML
jgi:hypothetical protein